MRHYSHNIDSHSCTHYKGPKGFALKKRKNKRFDLITEKKDWKKSLLADRTTVLSPLTLAGVQHQVLVVLGADGQLVFCRVEDVEQQVTLAGAVGEHKDKGVRWAQWAEPRAWLRIATQKFGHAS